MAAARLSVQTRQAVAQRAQGLCEYCQSPEAYCPDSFTVDHVVPRQQGGTDDLENLAWACFGCNGRKHAKTAGVDPQIQQSVALFNPRQQSWSEHFAWCEDLHTVIGTTSYGRATVETLGLNRLSVVNLRRVLMRVGEHPAQASE
jgi:5-methylcytosine-specific restriction endonuclease McrA